MQKRHVRPSRHAALLIHPQLSAQDLPAFNADLMQFQDVDTAPAKATGTRSPLARTRQLVGPTCSLAP